MAVDADDDLPGQVAELSEPLAVFTGIVDIRDEQSEVCKLGKDRCYRALECAEMQATGVPSEEGQMQVVPADREP